MSASYYVQIVDFAGPTRIYDYDRDTALANIRRVAPKARVFETSAKTGQGLDAWHEFLVQQHREHKALDPLA